MDQHSHLGVGDQLPGGYHLVVDHLDLLDSYFASQELRVGLRLVHALRYRWWAGYIEFGLSRWVLHLHPRLPEVGRGETRHAGESWLDLGYHRLRLQAEAAEYVVNGLRLRLLLAWELLGRSLRHAAIHDVQEVIGTRNHVT